MRDAVIVEAVRTAVGRKNGKLKDSRPDELLGAVISEAINRAGIDPKDVDNVIGGCVSQVGEQGANIPRNAVLAAGLPIDIPATSVNYQCGSSEQAIHLIAQGVISGTFDVGIACGVECMTRIPMGSDFMNGPGMPFGPKITSKFALVPQGFSAEMIAEKWQITRQELDEFSYNSHIKAASAIKEGYFKKEILPVEVKVDGQTMMFDTDEGVRAEVSLEKMLTLKPAFKPPNGVITAGNSSQISDGASALLIMTSQKAEEMGLKPRAKIIGMALTGVDPVIMLTGPINATPKALKNAGLNLRDIDLFEINEAFAAVVLAWHKELKPDMDKVNVNGGAVAIGHPLGGSGGRLMATLLHEMERRDVKYGLQTMCCGGGMGIATIIERV